MLEKNTWSSACWSPAALPSAPRERPQICWSRSWVLHCWSKADTENVNSVGTLGLGAAARACEATKRRSHMPVYQCVTSREQLGTEEEKLGLKTCRWFDRPTGVRESAIISHQGVHQTWNLSNQTFYTSIFTRNVKMYPKVGRQNYVRERAKFKFHPCIISLVGWKPCNWMS